MSSLPELWRWRHLLARRIVQLGVLALFAGSLHAGWTLLGRPVLSGNLSASSLLGAVPLADPYATLQLLLAGRGIDLELMLGAAIVVVFWGVVGGRSFCSWLCPVNLASDTAGWLRRRLGLTNTSRVRRGWRYAIMTLALVVSALTGLAAFELLSPVGLAQRGLIHGALGGLTVLGLVALFELLVLRHGWCGHLCPLGGFWALVGRAALVRVGFEPEGCTPCGRCHAVCPEPQVLDLKRAAVRGFIASGECSNCGRCIAACPVSSLRFGWRWRLQRGAV